MLHKPRKRFGQHFLRDEAIIHEIIDVLSPSPDDLVVEIGPGDGALTLPLLRRHKKLTVIEFDRDLIFPLAEKAKNLGELILHNADALRFDFTALAPFRKKIRLIGNLPYNISTSLIFALLEQKSVVQDMIFMLQKEVVDRLVAEPHTHAYGRLSVMAQYHCEIESLFNVSKEAFSPPPQVRSAVVHCIPFATLPNPAKDMTLFQEVVREAFNQRRKTLHNSLKKYFTEDDFLTCEIDDKKRAENLSVAEFVRLANQLAYERARVL